MKRQQNQPGEIVGRRAATVSRFLFISAFVGLLIGLVEAALLWTTPRVIPLLAPDVGWVVWFLVPLVDMLFFALVGLGLGFAASRTAHKEVFVAAGAGITVTFVTLMLAWFHREIGLHPFDFQMEIVYPLAVFVPVTVVSFVVLAAVWHRLAAVGDRWLDKLARPLARGLAAFAMIATAALGVFVDRPTFSGTPVQAVAPPSGAPNIVFITLDTVRADHLSSYGYSRPTTPNIDRFARTGVLFENAIAPSSWTLASHSSMFTGLLPQQQGAGWAVPLASNPWTLAEILRSRGYQTAGFAANEYYMQKGWGIAQGFETYNDNSSSLRHNLAQLFVGNAILQPLYQSFWRYDSFSRRDAQEINRNVYSWYGRRSDRPYFLFINYIDTHDPYLTTGPYEGRFGRVSRDVARKLRSAGETGASYEFSPGERESMIAGYDNCLAYLDAQVGELLAFLRNSPEWANTIVIITSDHGEAFGGHADYMHGFDLYRQVLHVPLALAGPGVPQDLRISHVVGTRQLFSTVLDLAGRGETPFSRTSLARFWRPDLKPSPFDDAVVSELVPVFDSGALRPMASLTTPQWQYIEHRDGRQELYNWKADPREQKNLAAAPGEQATLQDLRSRLVELVSDAVGPWRAPEYLDALDSVSGPARLSLLHPQPFQPGDPKYRIGMAQAYFKPDESAPTGPSQAERELMRSLPYQ